jgi:dTDP-4-dehydrorhamnose 3,5-epimerase-like enzyme
MVRDLSQIHELVGDLIRLPRTRAEWDQYRLSDEQVEFFRSEGYLPGIRVLTDEQIEQLRGELAEFFRPEHPGRELWYE